MKKAGVFTKVLAVTGTVLVWLPIVATVALSLVGSLAGRVFRFDYLMPAELFPAAFLGGGLLVWASLRARSRRGLIGWGLGLMLGSLVGGQVIASLTGLASGETEPTGWAWALVIAAIAAYTLALVELGIAGIMLVRGLFQRS
jgi:hypothetical protein